MNASRFPVLASAAARSALRALLLALTISPLLPSVPAATRPSAPPHYPDAVHVLNGCYLSTVAYLARFSAEFPDEQARPLTVRLVNADGKVRPHTITLLTWHGAWWGRDEYFGVFAIHGAARTARAERLEAEAESALDRHARDLVRTGTVSLPAPAPGRLSAQQRARAVDTARTMLPFATEQFRVMCGREELAFLFFRPAAGCIAVYDPLNGTASAETASTNVAKIVELIATRLGYQVSSIQGVAATSSVLVATAATVVPSS